MDSGDSHLWGVLSNAEWDLFKWAFRQIAWATVFTVIVAGARKIKDRVSDWWILGAVFVLSLLVLYLTAERPRSVGVQEAQTPEPATISSPTVKIVPVEVTRKRQTDQKFASLLLNFPPTGNLPSPFDSRPRRKTVAIRTNTSSYDRAKVLSEWFVDAQWVVVEVADTLSEKFADGITIRAPYDSGDAENVHAALCKLGYRVNREVIEAPLSPTLSLGIPRPSLPDYIILEIGNLSLIH